MFRRAIAWFKSTHTEKKNMSNTQGSVHARARTHTTYALGMRMGRAWHKRTVQFKVFRFLGGSEDSEGHLGAAQYCMYVYVLHVP